MKHGVALANALMPQTGPGADVHTAWHGKSPMTIAGACVWIVASLPRGTDVPLADIAKECGVAEQTIRQARAERRGGTGRAGRPRLHSCCDLRLRLMPPRKVPPTHAQPHQVYREIYPHLPSLVAKAGGFATREEISRLPVPAGCSHVFSAKQQQQSAAPLPPAPTLQQAAAASQALLLAQAQARQAAAAAAGGHSKLRGPSVTAEASPPPRVGGPH